MKRYTIQGICRQAECSSNAEESYEYGYSVMDNLYGDYIYEFTDRDTACWYYEHNYELEL